jgi:hypothetical protein
MEGNTAMSEPIEPTTSTTETEASEHTESAFEPITLDSQGAVDAFIGSRVKKARASEAAKFADYETFKSKAAELDSLKAAKMTQGEKDAERIRELETVIAHRDEALAAERLAGLRRDVANAKGVPADRITGDTREALEASADDLLEWHKAGAPPKPKLPVGALRSGASNTADARMDKKERAAAMLRELYHK